MSVVNIISNVVDTMKSYAYSSAVQDAANEITFNMTYADYSNWYLGAPVLAVHADGDEYFGAVTNLDVPNSVAVTFNDDIAYGDISSLDMDVNYIYGHPLDVFNELVKMSKNPDYDSRKFPMIALMQDFKEDGSAGFEAVPSFDIIIATDTKAEFNAAERYANSFDDKLQPLYERFIHYLERSTDVYWRKADHKKIDRLYWGKTGALGNDGNMTSDFVDAIEMNIEINILKTC